MLKRLLSFFLDGSRRVFKVDDMGFVLPGGRNVIYPIIAGQIGVGCTHREKGIFERLEEFCSLSRQNKTFVVERAVDKYLDKNMEKMREFSKQL